MDAYPVRATTRSRVQRALKGALAAAAALALAFAGIAISPDAQVAQANPAAAAGTTTISAVGAYSGTVPAGVCSVTATVLGAAGGSSVTTAPNANGAGARVTATYPVVPGLAYNGTVGGGGAGATSGTNAGGSNGGGAGGVAQTDHHGAGGGGFTSLNLGGTPAIIAGGGGGAGGGHSTGTNGAGGNAGLPSASGVANGSTGNVGRDTPLATVVGGGVGGSGSAGAGGVNSANATVNGIAASGSTGGKGGADPNYDAGGGGGGGYRGGGGGASTVVQNSGTLEIAGAGGGGGSSYVEPSVPLGAGTSTPSGISSIAGAKLPGAGNGASGSVSLVWNSCVYDLAVDKTVAPVNTPINGTVTWTVTVTNLGPSAMTQGDTVTIADTLPGVGAKTITAISVSGGSNAILGRGTFSCTAAVGAAMPASLDCSRPYQIGAGAASGVRGLDVGETLTVTYTQVVSEAVGTVLTNTATVVDRTTGDSNDTDTAATTVVAPPGAVNDVSNGNALGTTVNVTVTANDTGILVPGSVTLWNPAGAGSPIASPYVVAGQGTWTVASNVVTFTPAPGYQGDPTPVTYRVTATNGLHATATVTITYIPTATNDVRTNLVIGAVTSVPVLTNDVGDWTVSLLRLVDPGTGTGTASPVVVAGQGTWSISGANVVFTPAPGFVSDPTPMTYRITDSTGDTVSATVTLNYVPGAANDSSLGNPLDLPVNVSVLTNDTGNFTVGSLVFLSGLGTTLSVPGEGTWTVQPGGVIRFTPAPGYKGDPTPVSYRITDTTGDFATAVVTVAYVPAAVNDSSSGNTLGATVTVPVLTNDNGTWAAGSLRIMDGLIPVASLPVAGQGTWSVVGTSIQFVPLPGFLTDPTPVFYRVQDTSGDFATATVTVAYLPQAANDSLSGLTIGLPATVHPLTNDTGNWTVSTLRLVDPGTGTPTAGPVVIAGQGSWSISGADIVFTPLPGFLLDPAPISYRITDSTGDTVSATISLDYSPRALDDSSSGNALGSVVNLNVLANDTGNFDTDTLGFAPGNVGVGASHLVGGQGLWTVSAPGVITFAPAPGYQGDPSPVAYVVRDTLGDATGALMTITYIPAADDDSSLGNAFGTDVNVDVLANDDGDFVAGSVSIMDGVLPVPSLIVPGQGTWSVQPDDTITFHPEPGFLTDPTPIHYRVQDSTGDFATAVVTVTYVPLAVDDAQGGLAIGTVATVSVLANDRGDFVIPSLRLVDPLTGTPSAGPVTVAGEGVWSISGANVVFTPAPLFLVDPAPISYRITDSTGDTATAQITLDYGPGAADDVDLGNVVGTVVDVSVFANDSGSFNPATLGFGGAGVGPGTLLAVTGGTWSVRPSGVIRFTPAPGFYGDPAPVRYFADDVTGDPADAFVTVTYVPTAVDDSDLGNAFGTAVNVAVLGNDTGDWAPGTVQLLDGVNPVATLPVPGEGTWAVQLDDSITFTPEPGFLTDPTAVEYQVTDTTGDTVDASITVTYLPLAVKDTQGGLVIGSVATVPVLGNDRGVFDIPSLRLLTPVTGTLTAGPLTVPGQGVWSISGANVVFTPAVGFLVDPDPISYRITDSSGDSASATITLDYVPSAANDSSSGNSIDDVVDVAVLGNDIGTFSVGSLVFVSGLGTTLNVPGVGVWTVQPGGIVRFAPAPGYQGDPPPVGYRITDMTGDSVTALVTVTYVPSAADDSDLDNAVTTDVNVDVLGNDIGDFLAGSVRLLDGVNPVVSLTIPGQGIWTVEPDDSITFDPDVTFVADPDVVSYQVTDSTGDVVSAQVTVTYLPAAADDSDLGNTLGTTVNVPVLGNDTGDFVLASVRIVTLGGPVLQYVVLGQGTWRANSDGTVTFFPEVTFHLDPTPVDYEVTDGDGDTVGAQVTITYVPTVAPDVQSGNVIGTPAVLNVLTNDTGDFNVSSLRVIDPGTNLGVMSLNVPGEGDWTVDNLLGRLTFTPEPGYLGNPTPQNYEITDLSGDVVRALATVTYMPTAADDESLDNPAGSTVTVPILPNDVGLFNTASARIMDPNATVTVPSIPSPGSSGGANSTVSFQTLAPVMSMFVPGEGTWRMNTSTPSVSFQPLASFRGNPTPATYRVADINGNLVTANVTITYLRTAGLALTGMSVELPLWSSIIAIVMGLCAVLFTRLRRVARHRM